jgi:hypothetical protein
MRLQNLSRAKFLDLSEEEEMALITEVRFRRRQKSSRYKEQPAVNPKRKPSDPMDSLWTKMTPEQRIQLRQILKVEIANGNKNFNH